MTDAPRCETPPEICAGFVGDGPCNLCASKPAALPPPPVADRPGCTDFSPPWFTGRWRDWHRGHGCELDDGKPRTPEGAAEIGRRERP